MYFGTRIHKGFFASNIIKKMPPLDEQVLLRKARLLDDESLSEIYDRYSSKLFIYAFRFLGDAQLAEECVADTFTAFLQAINRGGGPNSHLQAYLFRTVHNWIADYYRQKPGNEQELSEDHPDGQFPSLEGQAEKDGYRRLIWKAMVQLTPDQGAVIMLKFVDEYTNEEIAGMMGKPIGAVKSLQHRAISSLRRILKKAGWNA